MNFITDILNRFVLILSGSDAAAGIDFEVVNQTLTVMGQGMLGIFVVMILIFISTLLLNKLTAAGLKKKDK